MNTALATKIDWSISANKESERGPIQLSDIQIRNKPHEVTLPSNVPPTINNDLIGSESLEMDTVIPAPVLAFPSAPLPPPQFRALQKWEGVVLEVGDNSFTARLVDQSNPNTNDEEVELSLEEISPDDLVLLAPGAIFYWS